MFSRGDGEPWGKNHQQRPLSEACKRAKIAPPLRFHEARHSYASALAQAGADLLTISKLLGHADTRVTSRHYAHLCDKTLANAVNKLLPDFGAIEPSNVTAIR
jgi:integrase